MKQVLARIRKMSAGAVSPTSTEVLTREPPWLHVRREPFEYGLLPLAALTHNNVVAVLRTLREQLLQQAPPVSAWSLTNPADVSSTSPLQGGRKRVATAGIATALQLSEPLAHLVLDTLASVLNDEGEAVDRLASTPVTEIDSVGADVDDLLLFLFIQSYKRVPSRPHRDAAAVADVWPSTSAIDGFLPSPNPLQARISFATLLREPTLGNWRFSLICVNLEEAKLEASGGLSLYILDGKLVILCSSHK